MSDKIQMTLADISGIDMTNVEEFRYENLPVGAYTFQTGDCTLEELGAEDKPCAIFNVKVLETHGLVGLDDGVDEASFVGKEHREVFFISEAKDIGRIKAFLNDIGAPSEGALGDLVADVSNQQVFPARIKHRADKNDKSIKYANLTFDKKTAPKEA